MIDAIITLTIASTMLLGSPGPATLSLAAVGGSWGIARGLPYLAGILLGLFVAMAGGIFGVAAIFEQWPAARHVVQLLGAAYLTWVAWRIASAPVLEAGDATAHNMPGFRDGFILNLLNPKAYAAFFVLFSQFLLPLTETGLAYGLSALVVFACGVFVDSIWIALGSGIRVLFTHPRTARLIRVVFGLSIMAATLWSLLQPG